MNAVGIKFQKSRFYKSSICVKLSALVCGLGNIKYGQIVKGLVMFAVEVGFVVYMALIGGADIGGFVTLGTRGQQIIVNEYGIPETIPGDNSMLLLLRGGITLVIVIAFALFMAVSYFSALKAENTVRSGRPAANIVEDVKDLGNKKIGGALMLIPLVGLLIFTVIPLIFMILIGFTNYDGDHQPPQNLFTWVGFDNFAVLMSFTGTAGKTFFKVLGWTLTWAVLSTLTCYFGGILLALLINKKGIRIKVMWRTVFILTMAVPNFITLLVMQTALQPNGIINIILQKAGFITEPLPFFTNTNWSRATLIVVNMWIGIPVTMLFSMGILQNVPSELYESARIDGASPVKTFLKITMPYVFYMTAPVLITNFIGNVNNFNVIFFLSGGAPGSLDYFTGAGQTDLLVTWLYNLTMKSANYSYASAIGIIMFALSAVISLIFFRRSKMYNDTGDFK